MYVTNNQLTMISLSKVTVNLFHINFSKNSSHTKRYPIGSLKIRASGFCVHPEGGKMIPDMYTDLVIFNECGKKRLEFQIFNRKELHTGYLLLLGQFFAINAKTKNIVFLINLKAKKVFFKVLS